MANAQNIELDSLKILLIGDAGTKKTILSSTFPDPHFVDFDGGMRSVRGRNITYITIGEQPTLDQDFIDLFGEKKAAHSGFLKGQYLIEHWANTLTKHQTLVIDSLTFYSAAALDHVQKLEKNKDMRQTYGGAQKLLAATFELLKNIECNVIVTAHRSLIEETEGNIQYVPKTAGKSFALMLPAYFDEIWRTQVKSKRGVKSKTEGGASETQIFTLETVKSLREQGKTRLNLPALIEEPTYEQIMKFANA